MRVGDPARANRHSKRPCCGSLAIYRRREDRLVQSGRASSYRYGSVRPKSRHHQRPRSGPDEEPIQSLQHGRMFATPSVPGNLGELKKLPFGMGPTQCGPDRASVTDRIIELVVAVVDARLQEAAESGW
jgi:hypothetical protein